MTAARISEVPTKRLLLDVRLLAELHSGSGLGGADIDALLVRDRNGKPVVRWSHFKGLLLEACRERAVDAGEPFPRALAERLFGREGHTGQERGTLQGLSLRLADDSAPAPMVVWASTALTEDERSPAGETLRRIEYLPAGTRLRGELRLPAIPEDVELLEKLLHRLSHLGGQRGHGKGLVHIVATPDELAAPDPSAFVPPESSPVTSPQVRHYRILFRALEPVCLAATGAPGNLIPTHSHLAGNAIGGMLARWALNEKLTALADALLDQKIVCGPAYPVLADADDMRDVRTLDAMPIPLALHATKPPAQNGMVPWWADPEMRESEAWDLLVCETPPGEKLKRPGAHDYLCTRDGGATWTRLPCPIASVMRNNAGASLERKKSRCRDTEAGMRNNAGASLERKGKQDLFEVEEIAEETFFIARLDVAETNAHLVEAMLGDLQENSRWLRIGRGGSPLRIEHWQDVTMGLASAAEAAAQPVSTRRLSLTLETDLILRSADFSFCTRFDDATIRILLAEAGVAPHVRSQARVAKEYSESVRLHGWNQATGGARLPAIAIRRGSSILVQFDDIDAEAECRSKLAARAAGGIGERTGEGYGRFRIDYAPSLNRAVQRSVPEREGERLRQEVDTWLGRAGYPDFAASRWHALRRAAVSQGNALEAWFVAAERELLRRPFKAGSDPRKGWLDGLRKQPAELQQVLGLVAAKRAQASTRDRKP